MWCVRLMGEGKNDSSALQVECNWDKTSERNAQQVHFLKDTHGFTKNLVKRLAWTNYDRFHCTGSSMCLGFLVICCCLFWGFFGHSIAVPTDWPLLTVYTNILRWVTLIIICIQVVLILIILDLSVKTVIIQAV